MSISIDLQVPNSLRARRFDGFATVDFVFGEYPLDSGVSLYLHGDGAYEAAKAAARILAAHMRIPLALPDEPAEPESEERQTVSEQQVRLGETYDYQQDEAPAEYDESGKVPF